MIATLFVAALSLAATAGGEANVEPARAPPAAADLASRKPQLLLPTGTSTRVSEAHRIVSLAPVVTETLFLLDRGDRVVGVTRYCDTPAAAQALPKVGGYVDVSLERVLSLKPDLVMAMPSLGQRELLERLRAAGIPVLALFGDTLGEVRELVRAIGSASASAERAERIVADLDAAVARFASARPGARAGRVLTVVGVDPVVVAGPGSFVAEIFSQAGVTSAVAADAPQWPSWSIERLSRRHVDVILVAAGPELRAAVDRLVASAFPAAERPRVVSADHPVLMRPGPALGRDLDTVLALLAPGDGSRP